MSCERQIEFRGPDADRLVQLMTPRDLSRARIGKGLYAPLCDADGGIVNDPLIIKLGVNRWWVSIADSDVRLWARGLAYGLGLDVDIEEADVWPLAVQGPNADELMSRVFGPRVRDIRFFGWRMLPFQGAEFMVMRSGYSKQGGFEIYLDDAALAEPLWDELMDKGQDLGVRAGGPNLIERIEGGLLSYGNDMNRNDNPFECGLDAYIDLDVDTGAMSLEALRAIRGRQRKQLMGLVFERPMIFDKFDIEDGGEIVGDIRSHCWSPRYRRHLAMAMFERRFLDRADRVSLDGDEASIVTLPFDFASPVFAEGPDE